MCNIIQHLKTESILQEYPHNFISLENKTFNIFKVRRTVAVYSHCIFAAAIIYIDALTGVAVPIMRPANSIAESDMDGCSTMQQSQKHLLAAFCNLSLLILFIMNLALEKKRLGRSGLNSYPFCCGSGPALHRLFYV